MKMVTEKVEAMKLKACRGEEMNASEADLLGAVVLNDGNNKWTESVVDGWTDVKKKSKYATYAYKAIKTPLHQVCSPIIRFNSQLLKVSVPSFNPNHAWCKGKG